MNNYHLHLLFQALGVLLGYMVMSWAPTIQIFAAGSIVMSVCVLTMVALVAARQRGEL